MGEAMHRFVLGLCLSIACLMASPALAETPFAVGQVWTVAGTDFPEARIVVDKLEMWSDKPIVHVSITQVAVPGAPGQPPRFTIVQHMPFTQDALRASVGTLVQAEGQPFAGFEGGYAEWQSARGGVFTVTVGQALKIALGMMPPTAASPLSVDKPSGAGN